MPGKTRSCVFPGGGKTFSCIFPESVLYCRGACRCVGIGRRGGLKIRWANNSCGFDPRHRHHNCSEALCFGAFLLPGSKLVNGFRERWKNGICGGNLAGKIQMCVDIGCGSDVTVPQPFLDLFQADTIGIQQAGAAVPLRYNYDKPEKPRISRVFGYLARFFILFQTEKSSREVVIS